MHTATIQLSDGRVGRLAMPDLYGMLMEIGEIPGPEIAAVLQLLDGEAALPRANLVERMKADAAYRVRLYHVFALCLEWPKPVLIRRRCAACQYVWDTAQKQCPKCMGADTAPIPDRTPDEIGARGVNLSTLTSVYLNFFLGAAAEITPAGLPENTGGAAGTPRDSGDVRDAAEPDSTTG